LGITSKLNTTTPLELLTTQCMRTFTIYIPKVTSLAPTFHQFFATKAKHEEIFFMADILLFYILH